MSEIVARHESLTPGSLVSLYQLDLNPIGVDQIIYFQQADAKGGNISFGGNLYVPRPVTISGLSKKTGESPAEPTIMISNVDKFGYTLLANYGDLLGAQVTRIQTYAEFLDFLPDGVTPNPSADSSAQFLPEIWDVEQKQKANRIFIQWGLKSIMDLNGKKFPGRLLLKKICQRRYRVWNEDLGVFKYATVNACPYAGTDYFKRDGTPTTADQDNCGKDPGSCQLRFPDTDLPGWFFPGLRRIPANARGG